MDVYFSSDTHFGDPRVLRIDRRPFGSVAEHDEALAAFWNETVGPSDTVWHLGDFAAARTPECVSALLRRLNGTKHLIIGNNDPPATTSAREWASTGHYAELTIDGVGLVLCHYPFRTWNGMGRGRINLHGHSHGRLKPVTRQIDVGVDVWGYRPVTLGTMMERRLRRSAQRHKQGAPG
jgi:calcineurin-like phosphoesterase family protein